MSSVAYLEGFQLATLPVYAMYWNRPHHESPVGIPLSLIIAHMTFSLIDNRSSQSFLFLLLSFFSSQVSKCYLFNKISPLVFWTSVICYFLNISLISEITCLQEKKLILAHSFRNLKRCFLKSYMSECFGCIYVCVPHVPPVSKKARGGCLLKVELYRLWIAK